MDPSENYLCDVWTSLCSKFYHVFVEIKVIIMQSEKYIIAQLGLLMLTRFKNKGQTKDLTIYDGADFIKHYSSLSGPC